MCKIDTVRPHKRVSIPWIPDEESNTLGAFPTSPRAWERAMLGPAKPRRLDEPIAVSLEDLVPQDHFYRHLEARLKLSFVREWTGELYAAPAVVVLQALGIGDW